MKRKQCATCDKSTHTLLNAKCGHKICYFCVKSNKNSNKCSKCVQPQTTYKKVEGSPSRKGLHKSSVNVVFENGRQILCKQHRQPLSLFCPSTHELICSLCLCSKLKNSPQFVPLTEAYQPLRNEVKLLKEDSKKSLLQLEEALKLMRTNLQFFQQAYDSNNLILERGFEDMYKDMEKIKCEKKKELADFFQQKIKEATESCNDLAYLSNVLKQHRDGYKENCTLNELIFTLTSYNMINSTIKNLDFDYMTYQKQINVCSVNKQPFTESLKKVIKMKLSLPLKASLIRRSANRSRNEEISPQRKIEYTPPRKDKSSVSRKHQNSWGGSLYGIRTVEEELSLYKVLLRSKLKI